MLHLLPATACCATFPTPHPPSQVLVLVRAALKRPLHRHPRDQAGSGLRPSCARSEAAQVLGTKPPAPSNFIYLFIFIFVCTLAASDSKREFFLRHS